uniref:Uncharacterized protein n=1 Tax=Meloidogyne hapla TaxID=6305 RepID=A0A1I8AYL2_MELHA
MKNNFKIVDQQPYFTHFEQIDFYNTPSFAGGEFNTNEIFDNFYVWFEALCHSRGRYTEEELSYTRVIPKHKGKIDVGEKNKDKVFNLNEDLTKFYKEIDNEMESFKIENVQEGQKSNFDNNSRLSRMSLNLYTLHGIAHLVHVAWPIAQHIIWNIECSIIHGIDIDIKWKSEHGKHWLEKVLNKGILILLLLRYQILFMF